MQFSTLLINIIIINGIFEYVLTASCTLLINSFKQFSALLTHLTALHTLLRYTPYLVTHLTF